MIEIAIVDDESNVLFELSKKIEYYFDGKTTPYRIHLFKDGQDFLMALQHFDLIFLDIQMDGLSGMDAAKTLRLRGVKSMIIFITVLQEYVYDAYEVEASDYLLKPLDALRFTHTMDRVCNKIKNMDNGSLTVIAKGSACRLLRFQSIYYCEAVNHKVEIHAEDKIYECYTKMGDLSGKLDSRFFQCHRSYFVNLDFVCGYEEGQAILTNGEKIPVSRLRAQDFSKAILCYMKEKKE